MSHGEPEPAAVVKSLLLVAEDLEGKGYPLCGVLRVAARKLTQYEADVEGPPQAERDDVCAGPGCGVEIEQKRRGRPRVYCTPRCRRAAWAERN